MSTVRGRVTSRGSRSEKPEQDLQLLVMATDIALVSRAVFEAGARLRALVDGTAEGLDGERGT